MVSPAKADPTKRFKATGETWQELAWTFYDTIGEFRYAVNWVGNIMSKANLYVADAATGLPTTNAKAKEIGDALYGGPEFQAEMLRLLGIQFTVPGDCWMVWEKAKAAKPARWYIVPPSSVQFTGANVIINGKPKGQEDKDVILIRLWQPHPARPNKADSPTRPVLPILSELDGLTRRVAADIDSRLAGAGVLLLPSEIDFAAAQTNDETAGAAGTAASGDTSDDSADSFLQELMDQMMTAIGDRESASAVVPIVLQAKGEYLQYIKHITMSTPFDAQTLKLREEAIRRLGLGLDMPPEILTGTADMNHWSSWGVEEAAIKAHAEPKLAIITESVTEGYLAPALAEVGLDPLQFLIKADTSKMRLRPNRSKEAFELWQAGLLTTDALLRENGFDPEDKAQAGDTKDWLLRKIVGGSPAPQTVNWAIRELGFPELPEMPDTIRETESIKGPENTDTSTAEHPVRELPAVDTGKAEAAAARAEVIVFRALERAGNRLRNKRANIRQDVPAASTYQHSDYTSDDIDALLDGAWDCVVEFNLPVPAATFTRWLDNYTRTLLEQKRTHNAGVLHDYVVAELLLHESQRRD